MAAAVRAVRITARARPEDGPPGATLTLAFERRSRSRQRVILDDGRDAALVLERGTVLRGGDLLRSEDGLVVEVRAGPEPVSVARAADPLALARAASHLGNRHVPVQVLSGALRFGHDHVLDEMVTGLGLEVAYAELPFEPEAGAYGGGHHHHHEH
jgi:urease accessory protein